VTPEQFGLTRCKLSDIETGTPEANAQTIQDVFSGKDRGPRREAILINAAGALYIGGRADSIQEGIKKAAELIDSGAALHKLNQLVETSKKYAVKGA
jgi:anthranilate phosphoribosyltransferase